MRGHRHSIGTARVLHELHALVMRRDHPPAEPPLRQARNSLKLHRRNCEPHSTKAVISERKQVPENLTDMLCGSVLALAVVVATAGPHTAWEGMRHRGRHMPRYVAPSNGTIDDGLCYSPPFVNPPHLDFTHPLTAIASFVTWQD